MVARRASSLAFLSLAIAVLISQTALAGTQYLQPDHWGPCTSIWSQLAGIDAEQHVHDYAHVGYASTKQYATVESAQPTGDANYCGPHIYSAAPAWRIDMTVSFIWIGNEINCSAGTGGITCSLSNTKATWTSSWSCYYNKTTCYEAITNLTAKTFSNGNLSQVQEYITVTRYACGGCNRDVVQASSSRNLT